MRDFLLNSGSTIDEGRLAKGGSKLTKQYTEECAVCRMNPLDYQALGCPEKVLVSTMDSRRSVAVYALSDNSEPPGEIFMPRAIWSNVVVDPETFSTGSPLYKGSPVLVQPTGENVLDARELTCKLYAKQCIGRKEQKWQAQKEQWQKGQEG
jgi:formylmethanofuran dehydrogenase subunit D